MTPVFFVNGFHDRIGHRRKDEAWLTAALADPNSRFVPVWQGRNLLIELDGRLDVVTLDAAALADPAQAVLLGLDRDGVAWFAIELAGDEPALPGIDAAARFLELRQNAGRLGEAEAALLAHAKGLAYWHARHRFCGVCGAPTESREAGHVRRCTGCGTSHFPRTDPAVIMLVEHEDRVLLGRQKGWAPGIHSVLAGFVEPGETLEAAVAREVLEETGIAVEDIRYRGSQPWPFPGSVMLGFRARARDDALRIDPDELEAALWVPRERLLRVRETPEPELRLSPAGSISRRLIEDWLAEG